VSPINITTTPGTSFLWTSEIQYSSTAVDLYNSTYVSFSIPAIGAHVELLLSSGSLFIAAPLITVTALESKIDFISGGYDIRDGSGTIWRRLCGAHFHFSLPASLH
jgi:hypothetical protein